MRSYMCLSPSCKKFFLCGNWRSQKPKAELPRDIVHTELFVESLGRCMFLCKDWKSHISASQFIRKHVNKTHRKLLKLHYYSSQTFTTRDLDDLVNHNHDSTIVVRSIPFVNEARDVLLLASLDGVLFVKSSNTGDYAFWNPSTGAYKKMLVYSNDSSKLYSPFDAFGLYYDSTDEDYKVLHLTCVGSASFKALIYSQTTTKEIQWLEGADERLSSSFWSAPVYLNESLYFIGKSHNDAYRDSFWIIAFDVKSEQIREILFHTFNQENPRLMVIKGCIHVFVTRDRCVKASGELWRMDDGESGSYSWTKVKEFPEAAAGNLPWTYDEEMEDLVLNSNECGEPRRKILYLETLVSPSC